MNADRPTTSPSPTLRGDVTWLLGHLLAALVGAILLDLVGGGRRLVTLSPIHLVAGTLVVVGVGTVATFYAVHRDAIVREDGEVAEVVSPRSSVVASAVNATTSVVNAAIVTTLLVLAPVDVPLVPIAVTTVAYSYLANFEGFVDEYVVGSVVRSAVTISTDHPDAGDVASLPWLGGRGRSAIAVGGVSIGVGLLVLGVAFLALSLLLLFGVVTLSPTTYVAVWGVFPASYVLVLLARVGVWAPALRRLSATAVAKRAYNAAVGTLPLLVYAPPLVVLWRYTPFETQTLAACVVVYALGDLLTFDLILDERTRTIRRTGDATGG